MTASTETAIVYVVSPDRETQLFQSIDSLLTSGSSFDSVRICCVGPVPPQWRFRDARIRVDCVDRMYGRYFYGNKLHLCDTAADRVIFLDSDTVVLRPIDLIWRGRPEAFFGRRGTAMARPGWDHRTWRSLCGGPGSRKIPMFNAGFLLFQQGAHRQLKAPWRSFLNRFLAGQLDYPWPDARMLEQWSLAMAVARMGVSFTELSRRAHAFGWQDESAAGAVVFHYGNRVFKQLEANRR